MGVQHTWLLVHWTAGERLTVPPLVHLWAAQGFLDHWLLQPSRLPNSNETGQLLHNSWRDDGFVLESLPCLITHVSCCYFISFVLPPVLWISLKGVTMVKNILFIFCIHILHSHTLIFSHFSTFFPLSLPIDISPHTLKFSVWYLLFSFFLSHDIPPDTFKFSHSRPLLFSYHSLIPIFSFPFLM